MKHTVTPSCKTISDVRSLINDHLVKDLVTAIDLVRSTFFDNVAGGESVVHRCVVHWVNCVGISRLEFGFSSDSNGIFIGSITTDVTRTECVLGDSMIHHTSGNYDLSELIHDLMRKHSRDVTIVECLSSNPFYEETHV